jgi:hypothetical protein
MLIKAKTMIVLFIDKTAFSFKDVVKLAYGLKFNSS